jgi:hypothetical protein
VEPITGHAFMIYHPFTFNAQLPGQVKKPIRFSSYLTISITDPF